MKTNSLILLIFVVLFSLKSTAKVITVNNRLDLAVADYSSLQLAYDDASAGDTLLVYPSETPYAGIDIAKKVILIGSGFTSTANLPATKISGTVNFLTGSDGSVIESFGGEFNITVTNANSIAISKNALASIVIEDSFNTMLFGNNSPSLTLKGNSLVEASNNIFRSSQTPIILEANSALNISNSIMVVDNTYLLIRGGTVTGKNNLIYYLKAYGWNIIYGYYEESNVNFYYSLIDYYSEFSNLFSDGYHLKPDSPASGTGENGTDMGIYGGATPFVDGGYPSIPIIYQLDVPLTGSQKDGINVTIKAKSNN